MSLKSSTDLLDSEAAEDNGEAIIRRHGEEKSIYAGQKL